MFNTLTAAKIYLRQGLFSEALKILEGLAGKDEDFDIIYCRAWAMEELNLNSEAEEMLYGIIDSGRADENVYALLQKIYTKTGKEKPVIEENIPNEEVASAYEKLGDLENAIRYYERKVNELKNRSER